MSTETHITVTYVFITILFWWVLFEENCVSLLSLQALKIYCSINHQWFGTWGKDLADKKATIVASVESSVANTFSIQKLDSKGSFMLNI